MNTSPSSDMLGEKVASSPALTPLEGWSVEDSSLSEDEVSALHLAMGVGMSATASIQEEQPERHTVADLSSLPNPTLPSSTTGSTDPKSQRLQPVMESQENSSQGSGESEEPESKAASFYIGGDDGHKPFSPRNSISSPLPSANSHRLSVIASRGKPMPFVPPDGGYGWVIAFSACFINIWIVGFIKSYGVIYVAVLNAFPEATAYHASWLPSLLSTSGLLIAPVTGILCRRFTSRKVSFLGGLLCFLGLFLGFLATSMNQLIFSVGFLTGLGAGLTTTPGVLIVSLYFEKRRAFASAICVSGNALGGFLLPLLSDFLLDCYGLRGTFLILAGLQLHICAASLLYRPISQHALLQAMERQTLSSVESGKDKLLPSTPASPWAHSKHNKFKPFNRSKAIWNKISRPRTPEKDAKKVELQHQVSFLRTSSMMNSIPDINQYARSWSVSGGYASPSTDRKQMEAYGHLSGSRSSLYNRTGSKLSMLRSFVFEKHPSVIKLSSEDGLGSPTLHRGSLRRSSLTRPSLDRRGSGPEARHLSFGKDSGDLRHALARQGSGYESRTLGRQNSGTDRPILGRQNSGTDRPILGRQNSGPDRPILGRQTSVPQGRIPQSRIMDALVETDDDEPTEQENGTLVSEATKDKKVEVEKDTDKIEMAEEEKAVCCGWCTVFSSLCDPLLLRNGLFWVMALSVVMMACGAPFTLFYVPAYAESVNIPSSYIPTILSLSSVFDLVGRLGTGVVSDLGFFKLHHIYAFCALSAGVSVLMIPLTNTFAGLTGVLGIYGAGVGSWFVMLPAILAQHHGASKLAASYGLVRLFNGLMNFASPQLNGLLFDLTKSYWALYYLMGSSMVCGALLVFISIPLIHRCRRNEKDTETSNLYLEEP